MGLEKRGAGPTNSRETEGGKIVQREKYQRKLENEIKEREYKTSLSLEQRKGHIGGSNGWPEDCCQPP